MMLTVYKKQWNTKSQQQQVVWMLRDVGSDSFFDSLQLSSYDSIT